MGDRSGGLRIGDDVRDCRTRRLFGRLGVRIVTTTTREAELAKLFTNAWRYLRGGGLEPIVSDAGLRVERRKVLGAGNIVIAALIAV